VAGLLRGLWDEPRPAPAPRRVWRDWVLVGLGPLAVLEAVLRPELPWRLISVVISVGLVATLLWRRTRPLLMVAIAFPVCGLAPLLMHGQPLEQNVLAYLVLLPYALFRWGSGREAVLGSAIMAAKIGLSLPFGVMSAGDTVTGLVVVFTAGALGAALRYRAGARLRELDQVRLLERERLAHDLNDTVAHHVSSMAVRAQAGLATFATDPGAATAALVLIESEASRALAEMRTIVRVLRRNEPVDLAPPVTDLDGR
jgi:signal transduction histidine kinase